MQTNKNALDLPRQINEVCTGSSKAERLSDMIPTKVTSCILLKIKERSPREFGFNSLAFVGWNWSKRQIYIASVNAKKL
jgi:hypothetical protein